MLAPGGVLLVYDFGPGIRFRGESGLEQWFAAFSERYPAPAHEARELNPEILAQQNTAFAITHAEPFEIAVPLAPEFYLRYMLTETNVAAAVRSGVPRAEIESWCSETLGSIWRRQERDVLFRGYFALMSRG